MINHMTNENFSCYLIHRQMAILFVWGKKSQLETYLKCWKNYGQFQLGKR